MASLRPNLDANATCEDAIAGRDLSGRVALVTGCNTGLGFETVRALSRTGARIVVACRTDEKVAATIARIRELEPAADLCPMTLELSSRQSIHQAVAQLDAPVLHVLVCNAGVFRGSYATTPDGFEETVGVCHLGHFLLFHLLRERLARAQGARVVMVSSEAHRMAKHLDFEQLFATRASFKAYGVAKLCNVLFASELSRRNESEGIAGVSLHPGALIATGIARHSISSRIVTQCARPFTKSVPQAAARIVHCAVAPEIEHAPGRYFVDFQPTAPSDEAQRPDVAARLWQCSGQALGLS